MKQRLVSKVFGVMPSIGFSMYRRIPTKLAPLYLGEISHRFIHRYEELFPLIYKQLQQLTIEQINPILVHNG